MDQVATTIASEVVVPSGRVLCTSFYSMIKDIVKFQSNLDVLEKKMELLLAVKDDVKNETEFAENEGKDVKPLVTKWLDDVKKLEVEVNKIQAVKLSPRSLNYIKRYRISRKVAKKLKDIEDLRKAGSSHSGAVAFNRSRPKAVEHIRGETIQDQTTSSKTLAEIMTKLSNDKVRRLGIWGLGGVGKTTLVRTMNSKLKNISSTEYYFGIVIWVTISKNLDVKTVQTEIAQRLKLEVKMEESPEQIAIRLHERLQKEEKFLLILDDVWEKIDLDKLGVPPPEDHEGSKILLTTRSMVVCRNMMTDDEVIVEGLNDEEAWQLFSKKARNVVTLEYIKPFAEAIAKRCCGLPLAIITVGTAMRGKKRVELWEHALKELQKSVPCIEGVEENLYKPLKLSYDSLEGKNIKPCFLYCSLFPEDFSINISELVQYWVSEGLIDEQENYVDSINRGIALIENLKDSCLLEDGALKDTIKMHDVVRDVAIWIASSSEDGCKSLVRSGVGLSEMSIDELSDNSLKRVSFMNNKIVRLPNCVEQCSNASTLLLQGNRNLDIVPEKFLQGFEALKVLNMGRTRIRSLPFSLLQLGELRALLLGHCRYLKELPPLEGLCRLQALDLSATLIKELPRGIENLSNLKQLNLSRTYCLESIQVGIISQLSCLEALDMTDSACCFSVKRDVPEYRARFEELKCLERLLVLCIKFQRIPNFSNEDLSFINRLRQFHFFIGKVSALSKIEKQYSKDFSVQYRRLEEKRQ